MLILILKDKRSGIQVTMSASRFRSARKWARNAAAGNGNCLREKYNFQTELDNFHGNWIIASGNFPFAVEKIIFPVDDELFPMRNYVLPCGNWVLLAALNFFT